jgi:hypothetical protein
MTRNKITIAEFGHFILASLFLWFCQLLILLVPMKVYLPLFSDPKKRIFRKTTFDRVLTVRKALLRGLHYLPWNAKCLVQALAGKLLLKFFHLPGTIFFGVLKEDGKLKAHAWLKAGNQFISGKEGHRKFTVVREVS